MELIIAILILVFRLLSDRGNEINAKEQAEKMRQERERKK